MPIDNTFVLLPKCILNTEPERMCETDGGTEQGKERARGRECWQSERGELQCGARPAQAGDVRATEVINTM